MYGSCSVSIIFLGVESLQVFHRFFLQDGSMTSFFYIYNVEWVGPGRMWHWAAYVKRAGRMIGALIFFLLHNFLHHIYINPGIHVLSQFTAFFALKILSQTFIS